MIATFSRILFLFTLLFLGACERQPSAYHEQLLVFGTVVEVSLWGVSEQQGQQAVARLNDDFEYMHRTWHAWHPGPLGRVNRLLASGQPFSAPPSVLPLIKRGRELSLRSGGLFNPAIGKLIALWGFASDDPPTGPPPDPAAIGAILDGHPSMEDVVVDGIRLQCSNPAVKLDFGAFAKGYAVDRAIERLQEMGITNAVVNAGGDLRAIGRHGDRSWRVGIRHPRQPGILAAVEVEGDESVFTSGDYERYFTWQGKRYSHIIDPRSGTPARGLSSVTVFSRQADVADAAATALFVAGPEEKNWLPVARAMGISGALLVDTAGTVHMTPGLKARIHFEAEPRPKIIYSEAL
jgi:thiamine biosynthesis lipoprotein